MRCVPEEEGQLALAQISIALIAEFGVIGSGLEEGLIVINFVAHREQVVPSILAEHTLEEFDVRLIEISLSDIVALVGGSGRKSLSHQRGDA